jgi:hypothetical protein
VTNTDTSPPLVALPVSDAVLTSVRDKVLVMSLLPEAGPRLKASVGRGV